MGEHTADRPVPHIVGAERGDGTSLALFVRSGGNVETLLTSFSPWLLTSRQTLPTGTPPPASLTELSGSQPLRYRVNFSSWADLWSCVRAFLESESTLRGQRVYSYADLPHLFLLPDPVDQWLVATGSAYFRDLDRAGLRRCTIAFATEQGRPHFPDVEKPDAAIRLVSILRENGELTSFRTKKKDEAGLLRDVLAYFGESDPDIVCGTELHSLYLPYLEKRCSLVGVDPAFGRRRAPLRKHPVTIFREAQEIPGRVILDLSDVVLNSELSELFGYQLSFRTVEGNAPEPIVSRIRATLEKDPPERVKRMDRFLVEALDCLLPVVRNTPLTPLHILRSSGMTRTEVVIMSRSLQDGRSFPAAGPSPHATGPVEPPYRTGLFSFVFEAVLAPTAISTLSLVSSEPGNEKGPDVARTLTDAMKDARRSSPATGTLRSPVPPDRYDSAQGIVQSSLSRHSRIHHEGLAKEFATTYARVLADAEQQLSLHNVTILQHLDGSLLFQLPDNARASLPAFWSRVQAGLPHGLRVVVLDEFDACVSLGPRIFALRTHDRIIAHRKARIPRFFEPFLRDFFSRALECSLNRDWTGLRDVYLRTLRRVRQHSWHVLDFARQETLSENFDRYDSLVQAGKRHPSAVYEAIRATNPEARAGTIVRYYITGSKKEVTQAEHCRPSDAWDSADPDENTEYYLDRLAQCADRFRILFDSNSFARLFGGDDLFGFDPSEIRMVEHYSDPENEDIPGHDEADRGISLDV